MALSGLDIYKLLAKTNCKKCGFPTCLAFAMQLAKKAVSIDKCPSISPEVKARLEEASAPPIRAVAIGPKKREIGNETVLFRHEEKFRNPCALGVILDDSRGPEGIAQAAKTLAGYKLERIGQLLEPDLVAIRQTGEAGRFVDAVKAFAGAGTGLGAVLMSADPQALSKALELLAGQRPVIFGANKDNAAAIRQLARERGVPVVLSAPELDPLAGLAGEFAADGVQDLILDTGAKKLPEKLCDLVRIRRLALRKTARGLGYPVIAVARESDPYLEALHAATFVLKYASIVLVGSLASWEMLGLMTLRQNIYTDPQKPLQIEPKVYSFGKVTEQSPVMVTTNFSLSFYTVAGEVEASKVPAYVVTVDTEGQSVLTAWASEKFNAEKVAAAMKKFGLDGLVSRREIVIPGYVAVMSGELEEASGWKVIVGPKEASAIPQFLKNLKG